MNRIEEAAANVRVKNVMIFFGAVFLAWAVCTRAIAQTANATPSLYNQFDHKTVAAKKTSEITRQRLIEARQRYAAHLRYEEHLREAHLRYEEHLRYEAHLRYLAHIRYLAHLRYLARIRHEQLLRQQALQRQQAQRRQLLPGEQYRVADIGSVGNQSGIDNNVAPSATLNELTANTETVENAKPTKYKGKVDLLIGHDNNLDPAQTGVSDTFFKVDPKLSFDGQHWSGYVKASLLDYENQQISQQNQQQEAKASLKYKHALTDSIESSTDLHGKYSNDEWPNYIDGPNVFGNDYGFPLRYTRAKLTETLHYKLGSGFTAKTGVYAEHEEDSEQYTDWAPSVLGPQRFRPSYNQYSGFGKVAYQAAPWVQLALEPSISDQKYIEQPAPQADGMPGGQLIQNPLAQFVTSELDFDVHFKFNGSTLTPSLQVGQQNDVVNGGDTNNYYGAGLKGKIMIDQDLDLYVKPSVVYTATNYSNFGYDLPAGSLRSDSVVTSELEAHVNITNHIGWLADYQHVKYISNVPWSFLNYSQDVVDTGVVLDF